MGIFTAWRKPPTILWVMALTLWAAPVWAKPVLVSELIEHAGLYDGKAVEFQGEALGDKMPRGEGVWVNIADSDGVGLGIWLKPADAGKITILGSYKYQGDKVAIQGVYRRSCEFHWGETDLHATSCEVIQPGYPTRHRVPFTRLWILGWLFFITVVLVVIWRRIFKRKAEEAQSFS